MGAPSVFLCPFPTGKNCFSPSHRVLVLRIYIVDQHAQGLQFQKLQLQATLFLLLRRAPENKRQMSTIGLWESHCFRVFSLLFLRAHALVRPWETGGCWEFLEDCLFDVIWQALECCCWSWAHTHTHPKRETFEYLGIDRTAEREISLQNGWYRVNLQVLENQKNCYAGTYTSDSKYF